MTQTRIPSAPLPRLSLATFGWAALSMLLCSNAVAQLDEASLAKRQSSGLLGKFRASAIATTTSVGIGSFVANEFSDNPHVTQTFDFRPRFLVGPAQTVRLRWVLECEYTEPDREPARACSPSDVRLGYANMNIVTGSVARGVALWRIQSLLPRFI